MHGKQRHSAQTHSVFQYSSSPSGVYQRAVTNTPSLPTTTHPARRDLLPLPWERQEESADGGSLLRGGLASQKDAFDELSRLAKTLKHTRFEYIKYKYIIYVYI